MISQQNATFEKTIDSNLFCLYEGKILSGYGVGAAFIARRYFNGVSPNRALNVRTK